MATRMDVARAVAEKQKISIQDANSIIGTTIDVISALAKKEEVQLQGLGTFKLHTRKARQGRNPRTGETIDIPERTIVRFKPSKSLHPPVRAPRAAKSSGGKTAGKKGKKTR